MFTQRSNFPMKIPSSNGSAATTAAIARNHPVIAPLANRGYTAHPRSDGSIELFHDRMPSLLMYPNGKIALKNIPAADVKTMLAIVDLLHTAGSREQTNKPAVAQSIAA